MSGIRKHLSEEELLKKLHEPVRFKCIGDEDYLEENVIENIDQICEGLKTAEPKEVYRQKSLFVDGFKIRPDIIIRHKDETRTIIEVKKANYKYPSTGTSNQMNAVGQLLLYGNVFYAKAGVDARLVLLDNKIYYRTYCAFLRNKLPIALVELQKDQLFIPYNGWGYRYAETT